MTSATETYPSAEHAFRQSDPAATTAYYDHLLRRGPAGQIAFGLFRASKRSDRAKSYRRRAHRAGAYDAKTEALKYLNAVLGGFAERLGIVWGWGIDEKLEYHRHVLYVELANGQCSFHSATNFDGPKFPLDWDGLSGASNSRVLAFCDWAAQHPERPEVELVMPFGTHTGKLVSELDAEYLKWLQGWSGLRSWPIVAELIAQRSGALNRPDACIALDADTDVLLRLLAGASDDARTESAPALSSGYSELSGQAVVLAFDRATRARDKSKR